MPLRASGRRCASARTWRARDRTVGEWDDRSQSLSPPRSSDRARQIVLSIGLAQRSSVPITEHTRVIDELRAKVLQMSELHHHAHQARAATMTPENMRTVVHRPRDVHLGSGREVLQARFEVGATGAMSSLALHVGDDHPLWFGWLAHGFDSTTGQRTRS